MSTRPSGHLAVVGLNTGPYCGKQQSRLPKQRRSISIVFRKSNKDSGKTHSTRNQKLVYYFYPLIPDVNPLWSPFRDRSWLCRAYDDGVSGCRDDDPFRDLSQVNVIKDEKYQLEDRYDEERGDQNIGCYSERKVGEAANGVDDKVNGRNVEILEIVNEAEDDFEEG